VHLTEREFRTAQPHPTELDARGPSVTLPAPQPLDQPPRTVLQALATVTRANITPALLAPAVVGATLGWWESGRFDPVGLLLTLLGITMTGWGLAALWDYYDYLLSRRPGVRGVPDTIATGYSLLWYGLLLPNTVRDTGWILLSIAALCSVALALMVGWPVLFFAALSFGLFWTVIALPHRYGFRGWGLGEVGIGLSIGVLPTITAYYVQAHTVSWLPMWGGAAFGLMSLLLFFNSNAVQIRRDWLIHKRTLTVTLGLPRALDLSALLLVTAFVLLLCMIVLTELPLLALLGLGGLPVGLGVFARLSRNDLTGVAAIRVYRMGARATVLAAILFCLALLLDRLL
jgi:1,4-dihydroxy-2-naphthoate polyprenyltransferase